MIGSEEHSTADKACEYAVSRLVQILATERPETVSHTYRLVDAGVVYDDDTVAASTGLPIY